MSSSASDPPYPVNRPFRAIHQYKSYESGPGTHRNQIQIQVGDVGKVLGEDRRNTDAIHVRNNRTNQSGWVPRNAIEIGDAIYGRTRTVISQPLRDVPVGNLAIDAIQGQFSRGLTGLLRAIHLETAGGALPFLPMWWAQRMGTNGQGIGSITNTLAQGVALAGLDTVLNNPTFTWQDIRDNGRMINYTDLYGWKGVYVRFYWNIRGYPANEVRQYVGSTGNFGQRFNDHNSNTWNTQGDAYHYEHYRIARLARDSTMVALCILNEQDTETLRFAEQCFDLLLESYSDDVLCIDADLLEFDGVPEQFERIQVATLLSRVAQQAQSQSQWPGGRTRPSFGVTQGLNKNSPVAERGRGEKVLWFKVESHLQGFGRIIEYQKSTTHKATALTNRVGADSVRVFSLHPESLTATGKKTTKNLLISGQSSIRPAGGTEIRIVFEFVPTGERHPRCWTRLPKIGCYKDWNFANSFAIRAEWTDEDSNTQIAYLQDSVWESVEKNDGEGTHSTYAWGIAFHRYFNRYLPKYSRDWDKSFGFARVRAVTFDHMTQTYTIGNELGPRTGSVPSNGRKPRDQIEAELTSFGFTGMGRWRNFSAPHHYHRGDRCDYCFLYMHRHGRQGDRVCVQRPGDQNCERCYKLWGRPCSWSRREHLEDVPQNQERIDALLPLRPHPRAIEQIDDDMEFHELHELQLSETIEE